MQSRRNDVDTITLHLHFQTDPDSRYRTPQPLERHVFVPNAARPRALRPPINGNPPNTSTHYNSANPHTTMRLVGRNFHGQRPIHDPPLPTNQPANPAPAATPAAVPPSTAAPAADPAPPAAPATQADRKYSVNIERSTADLVYRTAKALRDIKQALILETHHKATDEAFNTMMSLIQEERRNALRQVMEARKDPDQQTTPMIKMNKPPAEKKMTPPEQAPSTPPTTSTPPPPASPNQNNTAPNAPKDNSTKEDKPAPPQTTTPTTPPQRQQPSPTNNASPTKRAKPTQKPTTKASRQRARAAWRNTRTNSAFRSDPEERFADDPLPEPIIDI